MSRTSCAYLAALLAFLPTAAFADTPSAPPPGLTYTTEQLNEAGAIHPAPIPPAERLLPTVRAETWFQVTPESHILEGAIMDEQGNLLFCDVSARRVMRLSPDKKPSVLVELPDLNPGGLALHPDGRLFIAAINLETRKGAIFALSTEALQGKGEATVPLQTIIPPEAGFLPNDLAFDAAGGFYFTDFKGTVADPRGGVYHVSADFKTILPVLPCLVLANGVALSPDSRTLWATEFGRNLLHRTELTGTTDIAPIGPAVPYHFQGSAPDSMRLDADGNIYVALYGQGRVLVFNPKGIPLGQILLPGREQGKNLLSTSLALDPKSRTLFIVTSDESGTEGAMIFRAAGYAPGLPPATAWRFRERQGDR